MKKIALTIIAMLSLIANDKGGQVVMSTSRTIRINQFLGLKKDNHKQF
jgi:hypothetical protein